MFKKRIYSGAILILGLNQLIELIAYSIPHSYFPLYAISLGAPVASIGWFSSSFMLMSALLASYFGRLSDRFGRKRLIIMGLIGDVIFGAMTGLVPSWEWLLAVRAINGAVTAAATIPAEALLVDLAPPDRVGEATGFVLACGMLGRHIGPLFGGTIQWLSISFGLSELDSYRTPYFVDAGFAALSALLITFGIKETKVEPAKQVEAPKNKKRIKIPQVYKNLLLCAFILGVGEGFIRPITSLFFSDVYGVEPIEIGFIITLEGFITLLASWMAGRGSDKFGRKIVIAFGGILVFPICTAIPLGSTFIIASMFYILKEFMWRIYIVGLQALRADLAPAEIRGSLFGLFRTFWNAGDVIGPIVSSYLYDVYRFQKIQIGGFALPGYGVSFYASSAIELAALIILLVFVKSKDHLTRQQSI